MKQQLFIALVLFVVSIGSSTPTTSVGNGTWSNTGTWNTGVVPTDPDDVTIALGTTVTVDGNFYCNNLLVDGTLQFDNVNSRSLVANGDISVTGLGTIQAGAPFDNDITVDQNLYTHGNLTINGTFTATVSGISSGTRAITVGMMGSNKAIGGSGLISFSTLYIYGNTTLNAAVNGCINLSLTSGNLDNSRSNITMTGTGFLFRYAAAATMSVSPVWAGNSQVVYYNSAPLTSGSELPSSVYYLMMEGGGSVTLDKPITITYHLEMDNGILTSSSTNLLTIGSSVTLYGSSSSFVNGPVACVNSTAGAFSKTYPIGKLGYYRPVTLSLTQTYATASTYTVEVFNSAPAANALPGDLSLDKVSAVRYYNIEEAGGGSAFTNGVVTLSYDVNDCVSNAAALRIVKNDGSGNWGNMGGTGTAAPAGTIASTNPFGNITAPRTLFALANATGGGNPLPVQMTKFTAMSKVFALDQNYPNPFNPSTTINFTLAEDSYVSLRVFDMLGREVATLVNGEMKAGEVHNVLFDASKLSSGLYFYRLEAGKSYLVKKLMLLK